MPIFGNGPMPNNSSGLNTISSTTTTSRKRNGVRASPAPRRIAEIKVNAYRNGTAKKMIFK